MPAIAVDYPEEIGAVLDGITSFLQRVVIPTHKEHAGVLDNPRRRYDSDGRTSAETWKIISEVRRQVITPCASLRASAGRGWDISRFSLPGNGFFTCAGQNIGSQV